MKLHSTLDVECLDLRRFTDRTQINCSCDLMPKKVVLISTTLFACFNVQLIQCTTLLVGLYIKGWCINVSSGALVFYALKAQWGSVFKWPNQFNCRMMVFSNNGPVFRCFVHHFGCYFVQNVPNLRR